MIHSILSAHPYGNQLSVGTVVPWPVSSRLKAYCSTREGDITYPVAILVAIGPFLKPSKGRGKEGACPAMLTGRAYYYDLMHRDGTSTIPPRYSRTGLTPHDVALSRDHSAPLVATSKVAILTSYRTCRPTVDFVPRLSGECLSRILGGTAKEGHHSPSSCLFSPEFCFQSKVDSLRLNHQIKAPEVGPSEALDLIVQALSVFDDFELFAKEWRPGGLL